jgi:hypothetical protein
MIRNSSSSLTGDQPASTDRQPARPSIRAVVKAAPAPANRTELVPASDGFDWLDAAAGFGLAMASGAVVLLLVAGHRNGGLKASDQKDT